MANDYRTFPVVRVELEGMRLTLQTAISEFIATRDNEIREALDEAIKSFDLKSVVREQASHVFRDVVDEVVRDAIRKAVWNDSGLQEKITAYVADQVAEYIKNPFGLDRSTHSR